MKKVLKFVSWILTILIVTIIVLYLTAGLWLRTVISTIVPQATKTPVSVEKLDISLLRGRVALKGFKIGNPAGFNAPNAFELGEIHVQFDPKSLFTSKIVINEIKVDGTKIDAELAKTGDMNLMILNGNIQEFLKDNRSTKTDINQKAMTQPKEKSSKSVIVKDLKIINSSLNFAFLNQKTQVKLPDIREKNIGEKKKETLLEIMATILEKLSASSFTQISKASQESVNKLLDSLTARSKEASGFVKGLQNGIKDMF